MRLGIFGGSFDPPHIGHLLAAVDASEQLGLDRLFWIPTSQQPLKSGDPHHATPEQRYAMVTAAIQGVPLFHPSRIEIDRPGLSYTVTTLEAFAQEYPTADRYLLLGQDAWNHFPEWHSPERIRTLVHIAAFTRPTSPETYEGGRVDGGAGNISQPGQSEAMPREDFAGASIHTPDRCLAVRRIDVSSTEIRARVRADKPIRGFVQDAVADIIESQGLYRW